ncbi:hypothetical protein [Streptomyces sp. NPDC088847]|uniref:hypothetical protein n=1 Tax=Streptomyces sp. NPDC088847 TaxID=3365909 RepID=UPI00381C54CE
MDARAKGERGWRQDPHPVEFAVAAQPLREAVQSSMVGRTLADGTSAPEVRMTYAAPASAVNNPGVSHVGLSGPGAAGHPAGRGWISHAHPKVFSLPITDIDHLPEDPRHANRQAQHD